MAATTRSDGYTTDLTDAQWRILAPLVEQPAGRRGRPRQVDTRAIVDAIFYWQRTGCQWRFLPTSYPGYRRVFYYFTTWTHDGTWQRLVELLRPVVRAKAGRALSPSAAIIDSQSSKTTEAGGERGFDGGKKGDGAQTAPAGRHDGQSARRHLPRGRHQ